MHLTEKPKNAPHLPSLPIPVTEYLALHNDLLYEGFDIHSLHERTDWKTINIQANATPDDTFRLLPSSPDFEYGGYLTETAIHYIACEETRAHIDLTKLCTFHSHPTSYETADIPSSGDIYHYIKWGGGVRSITVGTNWIWVWTKDKSLLNVLQKLNSWENENMVEVLKTCSIDLYYPHVLKAIGLDWPDEATKKTPEQINPLVWSAQLKEALGISTHLLNRDI